MKIGSIEGVKEEVNSFIHYLEQLDASQIDINIHSERPGVRKIKVSNSVELSIPVPTSVKIRKEENTIKVEFSSPYPSGKFFIFSKYLSGLSVSDSRINVEIPRFPDLYIELK